MQKKQLILSKTSIHYLILSYYIQYENNNAQKLYMQLTGKLLMPIQVFFHYKTFL
jgi:uncharacterized protein YggT (Ycf19 family)